MADNTTQTGTDTIATDDVTLLNGGASSGVKVQRTKVGFGVDGTFDDVSATKPLPVIQTPATRDTYLAVMARVASGALTANTLKQVLSFEHASTVTKTMRLVKLLVSGYATTAVAGTVEFQISKGVAASSAGTAITPVPANSLSAAATTTVKSLPTIVAASVVYAGNQQSVPATANTFIGAAVDLFDNIDLAEFQPLTLRGGQTEGLVLSIISTAAINVTLNITAIFVEE